MVGVAGKSKACNACRARKIGCDLQSPECGQCLKRNQQCPGYHRETVFLNQNTTYKAKTPRSVSVQKPNGRANVSKPRRGKNRQEQQGVDEAVVKKNTYQGPRLQARIHDQYAFRDLFVAEFLSIYLPQTSASATAPISWLQIVVNIPTPGQALYCAMSALSLAVVGRARGDPAVAIDGARKYGLALKELQKALWDDDLMYRDQTLAACMTLILYEMYECPDRNLTGWVSHAQGMSRLVAARGPGMHKSPLAHELYKDYRYITTMESLAMRRGSFVHQAGWATEPWEGITKTSDQKLYDLGSELTMILERADASKLIQDPHQLLAEKISLISSCRSLDAKFSTWLEESEADMPSPRFWPRFSTIVNPVDSTGQGKVFPICFEFTNLLTAKTLVDYWVLLILLYSTILITYRTLAGDSGTDKSEVGPEHPADGLRAKATIDPDPARLPSLEEKYKPRSLFLLANHIAQSMEYMLSKDTGVLGPCWAFIAIKAAMQCYQYHPGRELQWLRETLVAVSTEEHPRLGPVYAVSDWSATSVAKESPCKCPLQGPAYAFAGFRDPSKA